MAKQAAKTAVPPDLWTRQQLTEQNVASLAATVAKLVTGVDALRDTILQQPKAQSYTDSVKTIGATVAIVVTILTLAGTWFDARMAPYAQTLTRIEKDADDLKTMKHRLETLEKAADKWSDMLKR